MIDLASAEHSTWQKPKAERPQNKQEGKTAAVPACQSIIREETQHLVMLLCSRPQAIPPASLHLQPSIKTDN